MRNSRNWQYGNRADRKLSERRVFPAIDIPKSGTRREDLLLTPEELEAIGILRKALNSLKPEEAVDKILDMFARTRNNADFVNLVKNEVYLISGITVRQKYCCFLLLFAYFYLH